MSRKLFHPAVSLPARTVSGTLADEKTYQVPAIQLGTRERKFSWFNIFSKNSGLPQMAWLNGEQVQILDAAKEGDDGWIYIRYKDRAGTIVSSYYYGPLRIEYFLGG